jgi:hypothetical protein
MIISDKLLTELVSLEENIHSLIQNKNINDLQMEAFLRNLEKRRYNILTQIKLYNKTVEYKTEQIKNISDEYKAEVIDNSLKIYIPEPMPSYKNIKTHAFKNILLNITEIAKPYSNMFSDKVIILITIYDNIKGWDIDNKFIKPISDALISSCVIQDDNIDKMFYAVKGEFSENPHTEVCITNANNSIKILENYIS